MELVVGTRVDAPAPFDLTLPGIALPPGNPITGDGESVSLAATQSLSRLRVQPNPAERIAIPRIGVNSPVQEVALTGKEWPVPAFAVGHLAETENPGAVGNAVFSGHLTSISSGNVFARLSELEVGDDISFTTAGGEQRFRVIEARLVRNTDVSVLAAPSDRALVTLITCAGKWIPRENDYDQRLIVVAEA